MLKNIGVENFKIFKDYTEFKILPITILTGPNNSGKSALNKLIHLIQQNTSNVPRYKKPFEFLNFNEVTHELGSFENSLNWNSEKKEMKVTMDFPMKYFDEQFKIELIYGEEHFNGIRLGSIKIYNDNRILMIYKNSDNIYFDGTYLLKTAIDNNKSFELEFDSNLFFDYNLELDDNITEIMKKYEEDFFQKEREKLENESGGFLYQIWHYLFNYDEADVILPFESFESLLHEIPQFKDIEVYEGNSGKLINFLILDNIKYGINKLSNDISNFKFIYGDRAIKNRFVNDRSSLEIEQLYKEFYYLTKPDVLDPFRPKLEEIIKDFLKILGIEGKLIVERVLNSASVIYLLQNDRKIELSDLGFGISQLLPILLKVIIEENKVNYTRTDDLINPFDDIPLMDKDDEKSDESNDWIADFVQGRYKKLEYLTFIIEEPEANLHPNLQSKLADLFVMLSKRLPVRFIIETHSEYLIRKLQYLTAKGEISSDDSIIYYYNDDKYVTQKEPKIKKIHIEENGGLSDSFGPGFYDEISNLKFDLLKLNQEQTN